MYVKDKTWVLSSSASYLGGNNLCKTRDPKISGRYHLGAVHQNELNLLTYDSVSSEVTSKRLECQLPGSNVGGTSPSDNVLQAKWVSLANGRQVLVLCSYRGIQMYEWDGSYFLHWQALSSPEVEDLCPREATFARGINSCGNNLICVGCWDGTLMVFRVPSEQSSGENVQLLERPLEHAAAISSVCGSTSDLASGDDAGAICMWSVNDTNNPAAGPALKKTMGFESQGSPVTAMCLWRSLLVAAYGSGHLRVFDVGYKLMRAEITAHAKWITGLDLAQGSGMVVSASEDSFFRVWKLNEEDGSPSVSFMSGECVKDCCLCGAVFLDDNGTTVALTAADTCDLHLYKVQAGA